VARASSQGFVLLSLLVLGKSSGQMVSSFLRQYQCIYVVYYVHITRHEEGIQPDLQVQSKRSSCGRPNQPNGFRYIHTFSFAICPPVNRAVLLGSVLEVTTPAGVGTPMNARSLGFAAGPAKQWYASYRIFYDPNFEVQGHKMWYGGMARGARSQGNTNPTQWFITRELDGSSKISQQNAAKTTNLCRSVSGAISLGVWHHIELHLVAESVPGAGDGEAHMWIDGREAWDCPGGRKGVSWTKPTHTAVAFDGFSWQMTTNDKNTYADFIRVGELYISGSNSTNSVALSGSMKALPTSFIQLVAPALSLLLVGMGFSYNQFTTALYSGAPSRPPPPAHKPSLDWNGAATV